MWLDSCFTQKGWGLSRSTVEATTGLHRGECVCVCVDVFNLQGVLRICAQSGPALQTLVFRNTDVYLLFEYSDLILTYLKYK